MKPGFRAPMTATLAEAPPVGDGQGWAYEVKLDGIRVLGVRDGDAVELWSRNHLRQDGRFPEIARALALQPARRFTVDGEVAAFDGDRTSFAALTGGEAPRTYHLFDLLDLDGEDLTSLPLEERKARLEGALAWDPPLHLSSHRTGDGPAFLAEACRRGWEGLIAKRLDAPYRVGRRSRDWLKLKCVDEQELVVGGWTDPQGSRSGFGALLVGYHDGDDLVYAGKVGTGFDERALADLSRRLRRRRRATTPFTRGDPPSGAHWVRPDLVAQVGFTEWTADGRLRHPRFLGLRSDKDAADVVRERPA